MKAVDVLELIGDTPDEEEIYLEVDGKYYDITDMGWRNSYGAHVLVASEKPIGDPDDEDDV